MGPELGPPCFCRKGGPNLGTRIWSQNWDHVFANFWAKTEKLASLGGVFFCPGDAHQAEAFWHWSRFLIKQAVALGKTPLVINRDATSMPVVLAGTRETLCLSMASRHGKECLISRPFARDGPRPTRDRPLQWWWAHFWDRRQAPNSWGRGPKIEAAPKPSQDTVHTPIQ